MRALLLLLGLLAMGSNPADAVGLGDAHTQSRLGQLLQVRINVQADSNEELSADCIRLEGPRHETGDDIPWLRAGKLRLEPNGGKPVIHISSIETINAPVLMLAVRVDCGTSLRREYTLLLNPASPTEAVPAPVTTSPPPSPSLGRTETLRTTSGETLLSIARSLFPADTGLQNRYITLLRRQNADALANVNDNAALPPGTALQAPEISAVAHVAPDKTSPAPRHGPTPASNQPPRSAKPAARPARAQPQLVLGQGQGNLQMATRLEGRRELSEAERERLRVELQLIATLDEKIATQLELSEKLRQLEALQTRLQSDVQALESRLQAQQLPTAQSASAPIHTTPVPQPPPRAQHNPASATSLDLYLWLGAAVLTALALLWWLRRPRNASTLPEPVSHDEADTPTESDADNLLEPLSEEDIWPDLAAGKSPPAVRAESGDAPSLSEHGPASALHIVEDVEEHDSAVELAEIMMSFGRVQGAAQTLADFIRANPLQAVRPWVKLLEVYKSAGMRMEFEALTLQLNKTFNVKPVTWDDFEIALRAPESLENMPHVQQKLCRIWGTRECQAWLHGLLRDNRQGTRQGFPLAIVDEILLLLAILESSLGAYKPDLEAVPPQASQTTTALLSTDTPSAAASGADTRTSMTFDFNDIGLDTSGLTRTLHLNLDDLPDADEDTRTALEPRRPDEH